MQRHPDYTHQRLKLLADRMRQKIYRDSRPVDSLTVAGPTDRIPYDQAIGLPNYRPARIGQQFGPLWSTFWFKGHASVPAEWHGGRVDLLWESRSEATLWMNGRSVQGLNQDWIKRYGDDRPDAVLVPRAEPNQFVSFEIEMACNRMFGEGYWQPPDPTARTFVLDRCDIALFDPEAWDLFYDFWVLQQLVAEDSKDLDKTWAGHLLAQLNRFANLYDPDDCSTWPDAHQILKPLYENRNATYVHELSAVGHAHIDTAWLWPTAETVRKCERTFSSQTAYMDQYPEYKFACSQAQQYAWIKEKNPELWQRMCAKVKSGQFIPVGGSWIEPDCNIPSGESLCRQFLHGQRFFQKEFGVTCREFWNPDVFGYNGQLPQICRLAGLDRFLTQKLSWNRMNKPDHHTFIWEGIDGSELFTHFPPADTYNATVSIAQLRDNARNYKDHDRSRESLMLFGFGDGGGGPTKQMLETLRRVKDLQGVPRTAIRTPSEFFDRLERDNTDRARLVGELYFEYHRGTYTSQAAVKRGNRKSEQLLHDVEFLSAAASIRSNYTYPSEQLNRLWKLLLLNQFHDILPGSSIKEVYDDARRDYQTIEQEGRDLVEAAARSFHAGDGVHGFINTTSFDRIEVVTAADGSLALAHVPAYSAAPVLPPLPSGEGRVRGIVELVSTADEFVLENQYLRATLTPQGHLLSLIEKSTHRESLSAPGNQLLLYRDEPNAWDAWDVDPQHMETESPCAPAESFTVSASPLRAEITFHRPIGQHSRMTQTVRLDAHSRRLEFHCDCDWHESHRLLKVAFPVNVRAMNATYEMQFGVTERPTHFNTRYDLARYEVPGHRFSDLSEPGFGVALLSESKYGYSTFGSTLRLSLLRAPRHPDPTADLGHHHFAYAIMPHPGDWRTAGVVAQAHCFNSTLIPTKISDQFPPVSFAHIDDSNLVLDTIKKAEDDDSLILRLYECHGARGVARLRLGFPASAACFCDVLERETAPAPIHDTAIDVPYSPFKILTLKVRPR